MKEIKLKNGRTINNDNVLFNEKHVLPYLKHKDDAFKYTKGSGKKIMVMCPICNSEKTVIVQNIVKLGFNCPKCSDKTSLPERVTLALLDSANINYEYQKRVGNTTKKFDFYLPNEKLVLELNGEQHYNNKDYYNNDLTKKSDKYKLDYCNDNDITIHFINCSHLNINNIILSVKNILKDSLYDIDVQKVKRLLGDRSVNKNYKEMLKDYDKGLTIRDIAKKHNTSYGKVNRVLQRMGVIYRDSGRPKVKVRCVNNGVVFNSIKEATDYAGLKNTINICDACTGKQKTAGIDPKTKQRLKWEYVD